MNDNRNIQLVFIQIIFTASYRPFRNGLSNRTCP